MAARALSIPAAALAFASTALLADGVAYRVKNLRTQPTSSVYLGGGLTGIDLGAMVDLDWLNLGREPWITDGTLAGTRLMRNLAPGSMGSDPVELGKVGGTVFLAATTPGSGRELWRTNGRDWGTAQVLDIRPGREGSDPEALGVLGDAILFTADDGVHGRELWASDGTTAGTWLVVDLWPGPVASFEWECQYSGAGELGGRLYFCGRDPTHGRELWATDGTSAGTQLLVDVAPGAADGWPRDFLRFGSRLFFSGEDPVHGEELWATDGTAAGTLLVVDLAPGAAASDPEPIGVTAHGLVFIADEAGGYDDHLWSTDGSAPGTVRLAAVEEAYGGMQFGARVLLSARDAAHGYEPWVTDGTPAGTRLLADIYPGEYGSFPHWGETGLGLAYFCADDTGSIPHLVRTDGTRGGTRRLEAVECQWLDDAADVGGATLLNACWWEEESCPGCGYEVCRVWRTNGTNAGTSSLYPGLRQTTSSDPYALAARIDGIAFGAHPDLPRCHDGRYLFGTDGTEAGTAMLTGAGGSTLCFESSETASLPDGEVLFRGWQEATGSEPWATDGGSAYLVRDIAEGPTGSRPHSFARVGSRVYFGAYTPASGSEPWISDGSASGTSLLAEIGPGAESSYPDDFAEVFGRVWFSASTEAFGFELWESGGTAASTLGHDLTPGSASTFPEQITPLDEATGSLVFRSRSSLYSYVPGAAQASFLKTLSFVDSNDRHAILAVSEATLYFVDVAATGGCELWASDGTSPGTSLVAAIGGGYGHRWEWEILPCPSELVSFSGRLFFPSCEAATGCELWTSDGTAAGTGLFADLEPGPFSLLPMRLTVIGERLYFAGCREATGCEPWVTDGTAAGTHRLADIALGPPSSDPHDFTLSGRLVYFAADDTTGTELWAMPVEIFYDGFESGDLSRWEEF